MNRSTLLPVDSDTPAIVQCEHGSAARLETQLDKAEAMRHAALVEVEGLRAKCGGFIAAWERQRGHADRALAAIERVRELHQPWAMTLGRTCIICGDDVDRSPSDQYPCATVRALNVVPTEETA